MVVVDKLSKAPHFIPVKTTYKAANIADIFMKQIFCLHGIPKVIISDKDPKFTSDFWKSLFKGLNTTLNFSTSFHPQTGGQTERVNQVLEYMLRMYVKKQPSKWEDYLHLVEFSYNNHSQVLRREIPMAWGTTTDSLTPEINPFPYAIEIKCLTLKDQTSYLTLDGLVDPR